jgi:hypothetical protein
MAENSRPLAFQNASPARSVRSSLAVFVKPNGAVSWRGSNSSSEKV